MYPKANANPLHATRLDYKIVYVRNSSLSIWWGNQRSLPTSPACWAAVWIYYHAKVYTQLGTPTPKNTTAPQPTAPQVERATNQSYVTLDRSKLECHSSKSKPKECYKCKGKGHFTLVCPTREQRHTLTCENQLMSEEGRVCSNPNEENEETIEEVLEGSKLPVCVIWRVLTWHKKEKASGDDWPCSNKFYTRVKHQGKALNLIIGNGSKMNVISYEIVQKLKLPVEKHPSPYKLSWVDDTSILIKHQCLVTFSLALCGYTIWCDVIPMKACHLLLGWSWLYDKCVRYDGYKNTYYFVFNGRKVTLQPIKIHDFGTNEGEFRVLTLRKFTQETHDYGIIFALVTKSSAPQSNVEALSAKVSALLEGFSDITPEDFVPWLPCTTSSMPWT